MGMTFVLQEVAAKDGVRSPIDPLAMGDVTEAYQSWALGAVPRLGYPAYLRFDTANGFEIKYTLIFDDATQGRITEIAVIKGGTDLISVATGTGTFTTGDFRWSTTFNGDDTFIGNSGNNFFYTDPGNDTIDGGAGTDTVYYAGSASLFPITHSGSNLIVGGPLGTDTLINIERLQFTDESIAFDVTGTAGQSYRLYQAALDRAPDAGGLGYYIDKLDRGTSEHDIAVGFINSPEFTSRFGANLTDLQYVQQLYQNVLHRAGESGGVSYQLNALQTGTVDRAQLLVNFSESPENQANLIGVMQQGMVYTPVTK